MGYPLSVHLYFYDDRFQGYLVRQEVQAVDSKVRETLEMWAVPQATLVVESNVKEFERLKNLEVSRSLSSLQRRRTVCCIVSHKPSSFQDCNPVFLPGRLAQSGIPKKGSSVTSAG